MQSWQLRERAREILAKEVGYVSKPHGGRLRVALAFPNTYFVGMSNLGFQTVYKLFNAEDGIVCERVFIPPKTELAAQLSGGAPLLSIESQTPVNEFDVFAFSVSFEWDYTNIVTLLRLAGLQPRAVERTGRGPPVPLSGAVQLRHPGPAGAVRGCDRRRRGRGAHPFASHRFQRRSRPRRSAPPPGRGPRVL